MLNIHIDTDNDAFKPDPAGEIYDILADVTNELFLSDLQLSHKRVLRDSNGNKVGEWEYKP